MIRTNGTEKWSETLGPNPEEATKTTLNGSADGTAEKHRDTTAVWEGWCEKNRHKEPRSFQRTAICADAHTGGKGKEGRQGERDARRRRRNILEPRLGSVAFGSSHLESKV